MTDKILDVPTMKTFIYNIREGFEPSDWAGAFHNFLRRALSNDRLLGWHLVDTIIQTENLPSGVKERRIYLIAFSKDRMP